MSDTRITEGDRPDSGLEGSAPSPASPSSPTRRAARPPLPRAIWGLFAVRLIVSAGSFVAPFLAMMLTLKLGYDNARAGVFVSALSVVSALGLALGGKLGDSMDKARLLWILQFLTAAAFAVCAALGFVPALPYVIAFATGTLSGSWPVINALVAERAPEDRRKEAFSLLYWGNNIGFSLGPLVAGYLFHAYPRALFVGNALALVVAGSVVALVVRSGGSPAGAGIAAGTGDGEARAESGGVQGGAAEPGANPAPGLFAVLRQYPVLALFGLCSVFTAFVYNQHTFTLPIFLADALGPEAGPKAFGLLMTTNGLTVVALTLVVSWLSRKLPSLVAVAVASLFYAVGFGLYYFVGGLPVAVGATVVWTVGEILGATNGNAFIAERSPPAYRSRVNSAISLSYIVGGALAPLTAGPLTRAFGSASMWPVIAATSLVAALMVFGLHRFDRKHPAP